ncbi:hypothetical protein CROQUDRAFT_720004 [Cronartium quercuum f. sp. fusiforme G11]|uniref:Laccase n=1 Tax=Cronartium quercuum f. sp. fusiforme G11 TaxID=708437 RepID=A0A9P6TG17_9BASI|nr:hypothetical protein CROQUDRAFT_720004 [Cronartium quercuum f. sp. fusiforme G11]
MPLPNNSTSFPRSPSQSFAKRLLCYIFPLLLSVTVWGDIQFNPSELVLSPNFDINASPQVRKYEFSIRDQPGAPDGFERVMLVINDQFPGPLIEANEGDTISVMVKNQLNVDVSIHWHGMYQHGTPWMDGVTGVTQCAIPAGSSFLYEFTITGQFGTYWYHAHSQALNADGIAGPLIVHSPRDPLKRGVDYDRDMILFMSDWYHDLSINILAGQLSSAGYKGNTAAPSPNSALINGVGQFDCQYAEPGTKCGPNKGPLIVTVGKKQRTRLRLIQGGSHAMFRVSADLHPLTVVEVDSTGVRSPGPVHRVPFHNGQRYSVILDTTPDQAGSSFFLRAAMDTDCFAWLAPGMNTTEGNTALAIINVVEDPDADATRVDLSSPPPTTQDWLDVNATHGPCVDLDPDTLSPLLSQDPEQNVIGRVFYESSFGIVMIPNPNNTGTSQALARFFVDNTTWTTFVYKPILQDFLSGGSQEVNSSLVTALTLDQQGTYDIVINNLDAGVDHVYHLHGVDSSIVAQGSGRLTDEMANGLQYRTSNPLRRDTMVVKGGNHIVLRIPAYNAGVWILHCHISFHLAAGFAGMIVMQPSEIAKMTLPTKNAALCRGENAQNSGDTTPGAISADKRLRARRVR